MKTQAEVKCMNPNPPQPGRLLEKFRCSKRIDVQFLDQNMEERRGSRKPSDLHISYVLQDLTMMTAVNIESWDF